MKLTRDPPRHDPVKEAIYNPKEFRGRRATGADWSANSRAGWGSIFLLVIVGMVGWFLGRGYVAPPTAAPTALPELRAGAALKRTAHIDAAPSLSGLDAIEHIAPPHRLLSAWPKTAAPAEGKPVMPPKDQREAPGMLNREC